MNQLQDTRSPLEKSIVASNWWAERCAAREREADLARLAARNAMIASCTHEPFWSGRVAA